MVEGKLKSENAMVWDWSRFIDRNGSLMNLIVLSCMLSIVVMANREISCRKNIPSSGVVFINSKILNMSE